MEQITQSTKFISNLLTNFKSIFALEELLVIDATEVKYFEANELPGNVITGRRNEVIKKINDQKIKYNLIFLSFPFNGSLENWENSSNERYKLHFEYIWALELIKHLNEHGILLTILPPSVLFSNVGKTFEQALSSIGYHFDAVFNLPNRFCGSYTAVRPIILGIRKIRSNKLFISDLDYMSNLESVIINYLNGVSSSLDVGVFIERNLFRGFGNYKASQQINRLQTHYDNYKVYSLNEITTSINITAKEFDDIQNAIYITRSGTSLPFINLEEAGTKHNKYFQVILNSEIVSAQYLESFFKSQLGLLTLDESAQGTIVPSFSKAQLLEIKIPIPDFEVQNLIIQTSKKLNLLKDEIKEFEAQLSLNPNSANKIHPVLNNALQSLDKLNEEDQILELIRQGESKILEFKQTFSKDVNTNIKEKEKSIRESSLKNIVAFLNSEGGTLLIGIKDNSEIFGIENDNYENDDKYLLNFKNNIKDHIGEESYPFVNWKIISVENKKILRVDCKMAESGPFFLNGSDFYVRTNPSADKLVGQKLASYLKERFKH